MLATEAFVWKLAGFIVIVAAFSCAIRLYRFSPQASNRCVPVAAILLIAITTFSTSLQFVFPGILSELRRNREMLPAGQWWRMITPLFVQSAGWKQSCFNGFAAVIFCPLAEKLYGKRMLALYFVPVVLGEIFAYAWSPNGAGSSLGLAGVAGALFAFTFLYPGEKPPARTFARIGLAGAVALSFCRDNHGPPIFIGATLASLITRFSPHTPK